MSLSIYVLVLVFSLCGWRFLKFSQNLEQAKEIGLPQILSPVYPLEPLWLITKDLLTPLLRLLPFGLGDFTSRAYVGWNFPDFYATHARLKSDAFTIVTPGELEVYVADAEAACDVLARPKDFIKSPAIYDVLDIFGPNLDTVNGETWQRHRRITVPPFNERNSALVWKEALRQSSEALESWEVAAEVRSTTSDSMTLALHVLTAAGFGQSHSFHGETDMTSSPNSGDTMSYRDSLSLIIRNMVTVILLRVAHGMRIPRRLLPGKMKQVDQAVIAFEARLKEMIAREKLAISSASEDESSTEKSNLMSVLLRYSEKADAKDPGIEESMNSPSSIGGLSDKEVHGNLFIYSLAGHDTTAGAISYAITLLAVYPQWQEWLNKEVNEVFSGNGKADPMKLDYETSFPKLQKCLALMYETLRLYGPVAAIPRYTSQSHQPLTISGKTYTMPPKTNVYVNLCALHTNPAYWGPDALDWRPDRWIEDPEQHSAESIGTQTTLLTPRAGTYNPWAGGPRICPGKKFAQVEFVAVMATLMRGHRVEVVRATDSETAEQARLRVLRVIEESRVEFTLKMKDPERVALKWMKR